MLFGIGSVGQGAEYYNLSIALADEFYGQENIHSATTINNLAIIQEYTGDMQGALASYNRALSVFKKIYGDTHPDVASVMSNLGQAYVEIGQFEEAAKYLSEALEMRLDLFGEIHEDIANSLNNLGALCSDMKMKDLAIDYYGKALTVLSVLGNEDTKRFATTLNNIGVVYYNDREFADALPLFEESLKFYKPNAHLYPKELKRALSNIKACYEYLLKDDNYSAETKELIESDYKQFMQDNGQLLQ